MPRASDILLVPGADARPAVHRAVGAELHVVLSLSSTWEYLVAHFRHTGLVFGVVQVGHATANATYSHQQTLSRRLHIVNNIKPTNSMRSIWFDFSCYTPARISLVLDHNRPGTPAPCLCAPDGMRFVVLWIQCPVYVLGSWCAFCISLVARARNFS